LWIEPRDRPTFNQDWLDVRSTQNAENSRYPRLLHFALERQEPKRLM
jgi:hypothetical protein